MQFIPAITFPNDDNDWLIAAPSFNRSPVAPVDSARSLLRIIIIGITIDKNSEFLLN